MKIYNIEKNEELNQNQVDLQKGYLKSDKLFVAHHEALEEREAVYMDRIVKEQNGGVIDADFQTSKVIEICHKKFDSEFAIVVNYVLQRLTNRQKQK